MATPALCLCTAARPALSFARAQARTWCPCAARSCSAPPWTQVTVQASPCQDSGQEGWWSLTLCRCTEPVAWNIPGGLPTLRWARGARGCQVRLVFPDWVEQDQLGLGVIPLDPKQAGRKVSAKPCEQQGDELTPGRAGLVGLGAGRAAHPRGLGRRGCCSSSPWGRCPLWPALVWGQRVGLWVLVTSISRISAHPTLVLLLASLGFVAAAGSPGTGLAACFVAFSQCNQTK